MRMTYVAIGAGLLNVSIGSLARADEAPALRWTDSYWEYHLTLRAPVFEPPFKDKRGNERLYLNYARGWHVADMAGRAQTADPPGDWIRPEFDASGWQRQRGGPAAGMSYHDPVVRVLRLRGRLDVPDPSKVTNVHLRVDYIGGAVAYFNGAEVARSHLPAGDLSGQVLGAPYPAEAYDWGLPMGKGGYPQPAAEWKAPEGKVERWRTMNVAIDPKRVRKGANVLAVAIHQSGYNEYAARWVYHFMNGYAMCPWLHIGVRTLDLAVTPAQAAPVPARSAGVHLWAEDVHRALVDRDWGDGAPPVVRLVGARNGTCSGQVVVGSDSPLAVAATMGGLARVGGREKIPPEAVLVRYGVPRPLDELAEILSEGRGWTECPPMTAALDTYAPGLTTRDQRRAASTNLFHFDHLSPRPAARLADGAHPVWVTVKVPADAAPGEYRGTLAIQAAGPREVPVRLWVVDWTLPEAKNYATFVGIQQSLGRVAAQYKAALWSAEHWRLVDRTLQWLAEVGNDVAVLPLVCGGEERSDESLVAWVRKSGPAAPSAGSAQAAFDYDWTNLDRYLGLVAARLGTNCTLIGEMCWTPYTGKGWGVVQKGVTVVDGAERKTMPLPAPGSDEWNRQFPPFARALRERVKAKGFGTLCWGWFYDGVPDELRAMADALAEAVPDVGWARASHNGNTQRPFAKDSKATVALDMHIRGFPQAFDRKTGEPLSRAGWKHPGNVLFPRHASEVQAIGRYDAPFAHRCVAENCLINGAAGVARLGADFWPPFTFGNWYGCFVTHLLYPGADGAEASVRFEAFREGVQEAEIRAALERAGKDQTPSVKAILDERTYRLGALPSGSDYTAIGNYYGGWQSRSWDLYAAAAEALGGKAPGAEEKQSFFSK